MEKKKMILDLDTGIDDALAIAYAAGRTDIELLGITSVFGNVTADRAAENSLDILALLGREDVPVYQGEGAPLGEETYAPAAISRQIHGENGVGEIGLAPSGRKTETESGVDFLIRSIMTLGKELTIVATGPLTNLAAVFRRCPQAAGQLGKLVIMGGAVTVPGNVCPWAEANILGDPAAAKTVFESGADIVLVGLDVTMRTLLTRKETAQMRAWGTEAGEKLADMVEFYLKAYERLAPWMGGCAIHDPLAVGIAADPSLAETFSTYLTAETEGPLRGRTIGRQELLRTPGGNTAVCLNVDAERYLKGFMEAVGRSAKAPEMNGPERGADAGAPAEGSAGKDNL